MIFEINKIKFGNLFLQQIEQSWANNFCSKSNKVEQKIFVINRPFSRYLLFNPGHPLIHLNFTLAIQQCI